MFVDYIQSIYKHSEHQALEPLAMRYGACQIYEKYQTDIFEKFLSHIPEDFLCPTPQLEGDKTSFLGILKYVIIVLSSITIVSTITIGVYFARNMKEKKALKRAKPKYAMACFTGAVFLYIYIVLLMIEPVHDDIAGSGTLHCICSRWLVYLGLVMFIVPIWVRLRAINRIFGQTSRKFSKSYGVKEVWKMAITFFGAIALTILYLLIWTIADPVVPTIRYSRYTNATDDINTKATYELRYRYECEARSVIELQGENVENNLLWFPRIINACIGYLLLYGFSIAQTNSFVDMKNFNDALPIAAAIWNCILSFILPSLTFFGVVTFKEGAAMRLAIYAISYWWSVTFFIVVYFEPKIIEAIHEKMVSSFKIKRTKSDGDVISRRAINRKRTDNPKSKSAPNVLAVHNLKKAESMPNMTKSEIEIPNIKKSANLQNIKNPLTSKFNDKIHNTV